MIKIGYLIIFFFFTSCANTQGISSQYYNECKEYYDFQGFYHKKCPKNNIISYDEAQETLKNFNNEVKGFFTDEVPKKETPENVW